jgi:hypothetical protein
MVLCKILVPLCPEIDRLGVPVLGKNGRVFLPFGIAFFQNDFHVWGTKKKSTGEPQKLSTTNVIVKASPW